MVSRRDGAGEFSGDFLSLRFSSGAGGEGRRPTAPARGAPSGTSRCPCGGGGAPSHANQTSNQTSGGSLVSWPRLPVFGRFPFHFPFRGEKGSGPRQQPKRGAREAEARKRGRAMSLRPRFLTAGAQSELARAARGAANPTISLRARRHSQIFSPPPPPHLTSL